MIYRSLLSTIIFVFTQSFLCAQIQTTAETRYRVAGIDGWQVVEDVVFAPKESKPRLVAVGWVTIDTEASIVRIKAETVDRKRLEVKQFTKDQFAILGTGKIWVDVTAVDFDAQIFEQDSFVIEVGDSPSPPEPEPEPNPQPDPDDSEVPEDQFENLGRRIDASADSANLQVDLRNRHAEIYAAAASKMETREFVRTSDVKSYVQAELGKLRRGPEWEQTLGMIAESAVRLSPLSWADTILWYKAVAAGLEG